MLTVDASKNVNFCGIHSRAVRKITVCDDVLSDKKVSEQFSRVKGCVVDSFPAFFLSAKKGENVKKRIFDFCKSIKKDMEKIGNINFVKYGSGSFYNLDDDDDILAFSAAECSKLLKIDELALLKDVICKKLKEKKLIPASTKLQVFRVGDNSEKRVSHYGNGYKLVFTNPKTKTQNDLFLKIYHTNSRYSPSHGAIPEILNNVFINHNLSKDKNFQQFYFGNTSSFMVTEFIEPGRKIKGVIYPEKLLGIKITDHCKNHNMIGEMYVDAGGIIPQNQLANNVVARGIAKKIYRMPHSQRLKMWNNIFENKTDNRESVVVGLIYVTEFLPKRVQKKCYEKILASKDAKSPIVKMALKDVLGDKSPG